MPLHERNFLPHMRMPYFGMKPTFGSVRVSLCWFGNAIYSVSGPCKKRNHIKTRNQLYHIWKFSYAADSQIPNVSYCHHTTHRVQFQPRPWKLLGNHPFHPVLHENRGQCPWSLRNPSQSSPRRTQIMGSQQEHVILKGTLKGHNGWVTQIATTPRFPKMILSSSRGKFT